MRKQPAEQALKDIRIAARNRQLDLDREAFKEEQRGKERRAAQVKARYGVPIHPKTLERQQRYAGAS